MNHISEQGFPENYYSKKKLDDNSWVIIYLDVFTLILSIFVILLTYKVHSEQDYKKLTDTLYETVAEQQEKIKHIDENKDDQLKDKLPAYDVEINNQNRLKIEQVRQEIQQLLETYELNQLVDLKVNDTAIRLEIRDKILFKLGVADLSEHGEDVLIQLIPILEARAGDIFIEGHTDSLVIATQKFPSNWELSTQRATTVLRFLIDDGLKPERLRAIGFADTQPIADNNTEQGRKQNRRVAIVIQTKK